MIMQLRSTVCLCIIIILVVLSMSCIIVNPLYNDIRYNSIICYNVNSVCTQISGSCIFSLIVPCYFLGKYTFFDICKDRLAEATLTKTQNVRLIKTVQRIQYSCFRRVHIKFLDSKFDLTAKSLVKNSVVITMVHCTLCLSFLSNVGVGVGVSVYLLYTLLKLPPCPT